ncbi:DUF4166 domain-containing protein [Arthrobacter sp. NPDC093139]|uniref:DUF4166 domain-containing protein n=1 Tax=Arthrobacter sp. NPDC093139 TaxID=3363945 RepID=UPI00380BADA2
MTMPIYQQAMGAGFTRLQPELQDYFSLAPGSGRYGVGEGTFDVVGCRQSWLRPLLRLTAGEQAFFPEYGESVPFRIENHAHLDPFGRSSLTARREIFFPGRTRIFQDTTSVSSGTHDVSEGPDGSGGQARLVDYVGRYRRLVTDLNLSATPEGRLRGVSEASRLFLGPVRLPLPASLDAKAYAEQWWEPSDGDRGHHRIQVKVIQPQIGLVLVYAGHFDYRLESYAEGSSTPGFLPAYAAPDRWEQRS